MTETIGFRPGGAVAFRSRNLRGLLAYARKHDVTSCALWHGEWKGGGWHGAFFRVEFADGVVCRGEFADASVMLGFFLGGSRINCAIDAERSVWNCGANLGRVSMTSMTASHVCRGFRIGDWVVTRLYRCEASVPMVCIERRGTAGALDAVRELNAKVGM